MPSPNSQTFQIHLSSLMLAVLGVAVLLLLNFNRSFYMDDSIDDPRRAAIGWPFAMRKLKADDMRNAMLSRRQMRMHFEREPEEQFRISKDEPWILSAIVLNCVVGIVMIVPIVALSEYRIRRRT